MRRTSGSAIALSIACFLAAQGAHAACAFSPHEFFPDRNDHVRVQVRVNAGGACDNSFREGPGYHFTSVTVTRLPQHGLIAKPGENHFNYLTYPNYKGPDRYDIRACATMGRRKGCSRLTYQVTID